MLQNAFHAYLIGCWANQEGNWNIQSFVFGQGHINIFVAIHDSSGVRAPICTSTAGGFSNLMMEM